MKIDAIEPVTTTQHRVQADARRVVAQEQSETPEAKALENSVVKAPRPAEESGEARDRRGEQDDSTDQNASGQGQSGAADVLAMMHQVKEEFEEAGLRPMPSRFAGIELLSPVRLVELPGAEEQAPRVTPMDRSRMQMIRHILRAMLSRDDVAVVTPSQLGEAHARGGGSSVEAGSPTPVPDSGWAVALESPLGKGGGGWAVPVQVSDGSGRPGEATLEVRWDETLAPADPEAPPSLELPTRDSEGIEAGSTFRFTVRADPAAEGEGLRVYEQGPDEQETLVALGAADGDLVYVGHLMVGDGPSAAPHGSPAQARLYTQPQAPAPGAEGFDVVL